MQRKRVFEGVKIAEFAWVITGPSVGRELAEHGATVVRIESHRQLDTLRGSTPFKDGKSGVDRSAFFTKENTNKYGMSLDLARPKGQEIARKLVMWADVVTDSMSPGVMKRLSLDYEACRKIKPDIIYFSTTLLGQYGPQARTLGYGSQAAGVAGFHFIPVGLIGTRRRFMALTLTSLHHGTWQPPLSERFSPGTGRGRGCTWSSRKWNPHSPFWGRLCWTRWVMDE